MHDKRTMAMAGNNLMVAQHNTQLLPGQFTRLEGRKTVRCKVVRVVVESIQFVHLTPSLVFFPFGGPVVALAKDLLVGLVRVLQRTGDRNLVWDDGIRFGGRVGLARTNRISHGSNATLEETMHLVNLALRDTNGVLEDAPVVGLVAIVALVELAVAGRNGLRATVTIVILGFDWHGC